MDFFAKATPDPPAYGGGGGGHQQQSKPHAQRSGGGGGQQGGKLCMYWQKGTCKNGNNCGYRHEGPSGGGGGGHFQQSGAGSHFQPQGGQQGGQKQRSQYPDIPTDCPVPLSNNHHDKEWFWNLPAVKVLTDLEPGPVWPFYAYGQEPEKENNIQDPGDLSPEEVRWMMYQVLPKGQQAVAERRTELSNLRVNYLQRAQGVVQNCRQTIIKDYSERPKGNQGGGYQGNNHGNNHAGGGGNHYQGGGGGGSPYQGGQQGGFRQQQGGQQQQGYQGKKKKGKGQGQGGGGFQGQKNRQAMFQGGGQKGGGGNGMDF